MLWFQTDPHLFHANILKFTDDRYVSKPLIRPGFDNVDQMNDCILTNHNDVVTEQDKVYWLGDITMKVTPEFIEFFKKFKGKHRIIFGNHDDVKGLLPLFQKAYGAWRVFREDGIIPFTCSHIPLDVLSIRGLFNVHGHIHQNFSPTIHHINICPEVRNYMPTSMDQLQMMMQREL
ncbi:MAG: hypothetical protein ACXV2C_03650, partial [Candidatus Bathyarchaeia archaeon]